jgi:hypothetical protein
MVFTAATAAFGAVAFLLPPATASVAPGPAPAPTRAALAHAPAPAAAPTAALEPRSFTQVAAYLKAHPEIRSVDAFVAALSPETRNHFVLMHESGSLQRGCVTQDNPRVIFTDGARARFMIAVANPIPGAPSDDSLCKTADQVEFIEFVEKEARFEMRAIQFKPSGPEISPPNPPKCLTCHTADPHPIWGSYHSWPGAYGSLDDTFLTRNMIQSPADAKDFPAEYAGYESFMAGKRHRGIYRHLNWANGRDQINRGRPLNPAPGQPDETYNEFYRPNLAFHDGLVGNNAKRVSRLLRRDPGFDSFKHALYYAQACAVGVGGRSAVEEIVEALPAGARAKFRGLALPRPIPAAVQDEYFKTGDFNLILPYSAYLADQLRRFAIAMEQLEVGVPRQWWGYLRYEHPLNPTNTELPRMPNALALNVGAQLAPIEYFWNAQGKTTRGWFLPFEGYIGTDGEELITRILPEELVNGELNGELGEELITRILPEELVNGEWSGELGEELPSALGGEPAVEPGEASTPSCDQVKATAVARIAKWASGAR